MHELNDIALNHLVDTHPSRPPQLHPRIYTDLRPIPNHGPFNSLSSNPLPPHPNP